jgi:hypothetical protein
LADSIDINFRKAYEFIQHQEYEKAIPILELNINNYPEHPKIDYSYGWLSYSFARLCQVENSLKFYKVISTKYSGEISNSKITRNWSKRLKDIKKLLLECDSNKNEIEQKILRYDKISEGILFPDFDGVNPSIQKYNNNYEVIIPKSMQGALSRFDSEFVQWSINNFSSFDLQHYNVTKNQLPFAVIGDFNCDKKLDLFLYGHNKSEIISLCVLSNENEFIVRIVEKYYADKINFEKYICSILFGYLYENEISSNYEEEALKLNCNAIWCAYPEKAGWIYYYDNGKFQSYTTSD